MKWFVVGGHPSSAVCSGVCCVFSNGGLSSSGILLSRKLRVEQRDLHYATVRLFWRALSETSQSNLTVSALASVGDGRSAASSVIAFQCSLCSSRSLVLQSWLCASSGTTSAFRKVPFFYGNKGKSKGLINKQRYSQQHPLVKLNRI